MNREILFRGKSIISNEWLYGNLITSGDNHFFIVPFDEIEEDGHHIRTKDNYYEGHYAVEPKSLGQYTGLKDKNGVRIFEGDIIQFTRQQGYTSTRKNSIRTVKFYTHAFCGFGYSEHEPLTEKKAKECIVVGNIYDNPELLKTK